jgi:hypothetical protein
LIHKFRYEVVTKATAELAWEVFSNWRRWHTFSNIYGSLNWTQGTPWTEGSRLRIEVVQPMHMFIDHVITFCEPARKVGWIDNAFGVVMEQWVTFQKTLEGTTRVTLTGEMVGGESVSVAGMSAAALVEEFTRGWYENFRTVCDELSPVAA